ncbi:GNAT family N-acetyltransferase [Jiangella mangrovi]|uniref:GNAT superfamily N-acetyltransferase n=1 Tax=Jiangella mangrovi TaxID=1524084 RepID=A0A7W9GW96_9ACTN|nr:GNAT family N-acetyltransferase [Jiangella mangrovi]MBB5791210.1 GNAT superfamily N-acetyltransferase [Jiangella mangrovi]
MTVRERRPADVEPLAEVLVRLHAATGYPHVLPDDPEAWIAGPADLAAFVAVDVDGGSRVVGQVGIEPAAATDHGGAGSALRQAWSAAHGRPVEECATIGRLFVDPDRAGLGHGTALLTAAVGWIRAHDLAPCLDLFPMGPTATVQRWYESHGWVVAGTACPSWRRPGWPPLVAMIIKD